MHIFTAFKELSDENKLHYASEKVVELVNKVHHLIYPYLDKHGHGTGIEDQFKNAYLNSLNIELCPNHNCQINIIDRIIRLDIYKYIKDKSPKRCYSVGHDEKVNKFKKSKSN